MTEKPKEPREETVLGVPPRRPAAAVVPAVVSALETAETVVSRAPLAVDFEDEGMTQIAPRHDMTGVVLADRYKLIRGIGEGGMGLVYEATQLPLGKRVAVKILADEMYSQPLHVERFLREARTTAKLEHENVVEILDYGRTPSGSVFIAMEYLEGEDLAATIAHQGEQSWQRTRHFMLQLCDALAAAHAREIVHRDIKPQNCFRTTRRGDRDFIKVLDFGIAKFLGDDPSVAMALTRTGQISGTPDYMSPEQIRGESADPRMDIYAAGVILYELLVGRTPYAGGTPLEVITKHLRDPIPLVAAARPGLEIAKQIDAVIQRAMAKEATERFQSAAELADAIRGIDLVGFTVRAEDSPPMVVAQARSVRLSDSNRVALAVGLIAIVSIAIIAAWVIFA